MNSDRLAPGPGIIEIKRGDPYGQVNQNAEKGWSASDKVTLKQLAKGTTPARVIGLKLGRSETSVRSQVSKQSVSFKGSSSLRVG